MTEGIVTIKRPVARQLWLSTVSDTTVKEGCNDQFNPHVQWDGTERGGHFWTVLLPRWLSEAILRPIRGAVRLAA